ncbi:MAG: hypothetical protein IH991_01485 [Planctomycetes bacterium]|nr:hypothetical protein [Planctomycetota bacterium]
MNHIVLIVLALFALIWLGASFEPPETDASQSNLYARRGVTSNAMQETDEITRGVTLQFDGLHPAAVAVLELLISIGALVASTPSPVAKPSDVNVTRATA